jgi:hypothetical protein
MTMINVLLNSVARSLDPAVYEDRDNQRVKILDLQNDMKKVSSELTAATSLINMQQLKLDETQSVNRQLAAKIAELSRPNITDVESYCMARYKQIANIAYEGKRKFQGEQIDVYLNQMITPDAFEVIKVRRRLRMKGDPKIDAKIAGDWAARTFTWTDDGKLDKSGDFYVYPEETIKHKLVDCEDHAFVVSSLVPEIGVAYGFYYNSQEKKRYGHAFNVFIQDNRIYVLDTVGNTSYICAAEKTSAYTINYVITKGMTFALDPSAQFGTIAAW